MVVRGLQAFNPYQALTTFKDYGNIYYKGMEWRVYDGVGKSGFGMADNKAVECWC